MATKNICILLCFAFIGCSVALPAQDNNEKELINMLNKIDNEPVIPLFGGLTLARTATGRSLEGNSAAESFDERAQRYLQTHELAFSFANDEEDENNTEYTGRSIEESRSKKMKKMLVPLLLILKLKKAVIVKVLFMIIKFISLKSLAISILALIMAGITLFKDLFAKKKEHITTAYITGSPLNAEIVHSDWQRTGQASPSDLAYNHYGLAQPF